MRFLAHPPRFPRLVRGLFFELDQRNFDGYSRVADRYVSMQGRMKAPRETFSLGGAILTKW